MSESELGEPTDRDRQVFRDYLEWEQKQQTEREEGLVRVAVSLVGVEVYVPQGKGRVISQSGKECVVRIYRGAEKNGSRLCFKLGKDVFAYRKDMGVWIRRGLITVKNIPLTFRASGCWLFSNFEHLT